MSVIKQAVLLAAGRGSRMGDACVDRPKALLEIGGARLLDWNLRALVAVGIERVCVVTGWQSSTLEDALSAHPLRQQISIETRFNPRWNETGPVRSLLIADDWLREAPTMMMYGDCAYAARTLQAVVADYSNGLCVPGDQRWSALWALRFEQPLLDAERWRSSDGRLIEIGGRADSLSAESAQFMGLCLLDPPVWLRCVASLTEWEQQSCAAELDRADITGLLARRLVQGESITCVDVQGGWIEIDSAQDLLRIEAAMHAADREQRGFDHDVRG